MSGCITWQWDVFDVIAKSFEEKSLHGHLNVIPHSQQRSELTKLLNGKNIPAGIEAGDHFCFSRVIPSTMKVVPNIEDYADPIQYLRAMHLVILDRVHTLEALIQRAQKIKTTGLDLQDPVWPELLYFFSRVLPLHERDEEEALFPVVLQKLPRMGFQPRNSPIDFLLNGHELLTERTELLTDIWRKYMDVGRAGSSEATEKAFLDTATELVQLLREHIATEDKQVYSKANDLLTPEERSSIMANIEQRHMETVAMPMPEYDIPMFSLPLKFTIGEPEDNPADAISQDELSSEEEDSDDDKSDK